VDGVVETSGSLEGAAAGVALSDFGWYFESAWIMPPFIQNTNQWLASERGKKERKERWKEGEGLLTNPFK
jgi:hypothetical protein